MIVIEAGVEDLSLVTSIAGKTWPAAYSHILPKEQINYMLNLLYSPHSLLKQFQAGHRFLMAFNNEDAQGFASWQMTDKSTARLHKLYVLPEAKGSGLGKTLLQEVINRAKKKGAASLELNVNRQNEAINFYRKYGFEIERSEDIDIGNNYFMNDYIMRLSFK